MGLGAKRVKGNGFIEKCAMKIIKILGAAFENDFGGVVNLSNHGHLLKDALWRIFLMLERGKTTFACNSHENIVAKYQGVAGWFLGKNQNGKYRR